MLMKVLLESSNKPTTKITVKHPGELEIPEGKNFWNMPLKHYVNLCKKNGYINIVKALTNLERWNKKKHPNIAAKASKIIESLKKKHEKGII